MVQTKSKRLGAVEFGLVHSGFISGRWRDVFSSCSLSLSSRLCQLLPTHLWMDYKPCEARDRVGFYPAFSFLSPCAGKAA